MVNVDGVVIGNFRTSLSGRDLNRVFDEPHLYKEVALVRSVASLYNCHIFFDFHGHSSKKYVFTYGPNYPLDHRYFLPCRLLPKLISKSSDAFRYYSCNFKIDENKLTTCRSIMLKEFEIIFTFTVEISAHGYGPKTAEVCFTKFTLL